MVRLVFVVQVPDPRDMGRVPVLLGPLDGSFLRRKGAQRVIGVVLHNVVGDRFALFPALGPRFDKNVSHDILQPARSHYAQTPDGVPFPFKQVSRTFAA